MRFGFIFFLILMTMGTKTFCQSENQGTTRDQDSVQLVKKKSKQRDPRRATMLSAVFPGAGQLYNRKYWKLPIVYGTAFALGYYINFNNEQYVIARDSYLQVKADRPDYYNKAYSEEQLVRFREYWRRNRDLLIIISGFTYLLNIADAAVDAHFSTFDVGDDLTLKIDPKFYVAGTSPIMGLGMVLHF